jgi:hypothetical protein
VGITRCRYDEWREAAGVLAVIPLITICKHHNTERERERESLELLKQSAALRPLEAPLIRREVSTYELTS